MTRPADSGQARQLAPAWRCALAVLAGVAGALAFSPIDWWVCGVLAVALLFCVSVDSAPPRAALLGWCFGLGYFGAGSSWIYVSISVYGNAGPLLAGFITALFVTFLALFPPLQLWFWRRFAKRCWLAAGFAATWVLSDWLRGWLFTGFPWLYSGSAHIGTPLSGLAPLFGVHALSFVVALSGAWCGQAALQLYRGQTGTRLCRHPAVTVVPLLWLLAWGSGQWQWTQPSGERLQVGIVQGNIAQDMKFRADYLQHSLDTYARLSEPLWEADLVVWPETAIPLRWQQAGNILDQLAARAEASNSALLTGIFFDTGESIHNSITAVGAASGIWHKQTLLTFGEYVPLRTLLSSVLQLFDLPMSSLSPGPSQQSLLQVQGHAVAAFICYEVVYPGFVRNYGKDAAFLVTISNDTWFGASWGPWQHLQIASMRSLELGRYTLRATNNGISALIDERGRVLARTPQFQEATLLGELEIFDGPTPYARWGSLPILLLCSFITLVAGGVRRRQV